MFGLFVQDLAGMVAFYRDVLDVDIDWNGKGPYAEFLHDGIRFAMYEHSKLPDLLGQECWWSTGGMTDGGAAVAKFCNTLLWSGEEVVIDIVVSVGAVNTGECTTAPGEACLRGPVGDIVHVEMRQPYGNVIANTIVEGVENGDELTITNNADSGPNVLARILETNETCNYLFLAK